MDNDMCYLQVFYESDGTRTRDLRRDRPLQRSPRLTMIDAQSLYSCGLAGPSLDDIAPSACDRGVERERVVLRDRRRGEAAALRSAGRAERPCGPRGRPRDGDRAHRAVA